MAQVQQRPYIQIEEYTSMVDIIEQNHVCTGVVVRTKDGQIQPIYAKSVVLATGGLGGLFQNSTNYPHITGDALAIALKHHIALQDINYIQIHPTTLYSEKKGRSFLISESVRGEGAVLLNEKGERFVDELLPRDVVTKAIKDEMKKTKRMLISALLVFTLCMLTACGNDNNNAADEVQNNANEDAIDKDNVEDGTAEDEKLDDAGDSVNNGADGAGTADTAVPDDAGTAGDADVPGDNVTDNNNSVSGALGEGVEELGDGVADGVRDVGEGVGNAVEDVGDAVDNAANGR